MKAIRLTLSLTFLTLAALSASASAQSAKEAPAKEPTDGFFDVPARPPGEEAEPFGLPAYMVTSAIGGLAVFLFCKSARR
jgi:hypothetical protein